MGNDPPTSGEADPFPGPASIGIEYHWTGQVVVVAVCGTVDMLTSPELREAISTVAAQTPAGVIVDLTKTEFLASAGMSVLVAAHAELKATTRFGVVADGPATSRPIKMLGLDRVLSVYRTLDDALGGINGE